jgi:hypothetical protein
VYTKVQLKQTAAAKAAKETAAKAQGHDAMQQ